MMKSQAEKARKVWISLIFSLSLNCDEDYLKAWPAFLMYGLLVDVAEKS